ncbi:macrophage mannose receptor 1-like [Elysia marginata]|uniref:Macrophage mannose receptor 1-like n=1 Tax=Elysia marginata TaxID=1093978 RepID=A0AAV4HFR7_9GAST|nr:macrophage mannose receptor 1-like [Elysia marginata]
MWESGQPNNLPSSSHGNGQDCVEIGTSFSFDSKWNDNDCTEKAKFICEKFPSAPCLPGWIESKASGTCIKLFADQKSWENARAVCQANGGDLVKILDDDMNDFIWDQVSADLGHAYWMGLHDRQSEGIFVWLDEPAKAQYTNWDSDQPNNLDSLHHIDGQDCAEIGNDLVAEKKWNDRDCGIPTKFICEKAKVGSSPQAAACPKGWIKSAHSGTCIKLYNKRKSWTDARAFCQTSGGDLVKIVDQSMNQFIWGQVSTDKNEPYWIGLHDRNGENEFQWLDDTAKVTYTNWGSGQPNNLPSSPTGEGQDCVEIGSSFVDDSKWNDNRCGDKAKFVCERSPAGLDSKPTPAKPTRIDHHDVVVKVSTTLSPLDHPRPNQHSKPVRVDDKVTKPRQTNTRVPAGKYQRSTQDKHQGKKLDGGAIAAIVITVIVVSAALIAAAFFGRRYYLRRQTARTSNLNSAIQFTNQIYASMQEMTELESGSNGKSSGSMA